MSCQIVVQTKASAEQKHKKETEHFYSLHRRMNIDLENVIKGEIKMH